MYLLTNEQLILIIDKIDQAVSSHYQWYKKLLRVLQRIVDNGDTVIVIEHNLDIIKSADYIIDLGPEGGDDGGQVIATGTPEQVAKIAKSYTGQYLKKVLRWGDYDKYE